MTNQRRVPSPEKSTATNPQLRPNNASAQKSPQIPNKSDEKLQKAASEKYVKDTDSKEKSKRFNQW